MRLQLCTWPEVETYLETNRGILIPIGSIEQHGPTGLMGTDAICAEAVANGAAETMDAMVAPVIQVGMAEHHMAFPGSMTLRPSTLIALVHDCVLSLVTHGFERFLFVNGHGGNIPTVQSAWYEIHAENRARNRDQAPDLRFALHNWWAGSRVRAYSERAFGSREGGHAACSEVSLTQFLFPDHIKRAPLIPEVAPQQRFHDSRHYRRVHPDGRMGSDPSLATPAHGEALYHLAVEEAAQRYRQLMDEP